MDLNQMHLFLYTLFIRVLSSCTVENVSASHQAKHGKQLNIFWQNSLPLYLSAPTQIVSTLSYCQPNTVIGWTFGAFIINEDSLTHKVASLNSLNPNARHAHKDEQSHGNCGREKLHSIALKHLFQTEQAIDKATGRNVRANSAQSRATWPKLFTTGLWEAQSGQTWVERVEICVSGSMGKNCKQCEAFRRSVHTLQIQGLM